MAHHAPMSTTPLIPRLLSAEQAAAYLGGLSPATLRAWARTGRIPCVRLPRRVRFDVRDLDDLIQRTRHEAQEVAP